MRRSLSLFLIGAILPLVVSGAGLGTWALRNQRKAIETQAASHAQFAATLLEREIHGDIRTVQVIAHSPGFDGPDLNTARLRATAERLLGEYDYWRLLIVSDRSGAPVLQAPADTASAAYTLDEASLRAAIETRTPAVGRVIAGADGAAYAIRSPVIRNGEVVYVLSVLIAPRALNAALAQHGLPDGWQIEVIDGAGRVVAGSGPDVGYHHAAHADALEARHENSAGFYRADHHGAEEVATWRPVRGSDWTVHVAMPAAAYAAPYVQATKLLVAGGLVSLILSLVLGLLLVRELKTQRRRDGLRLEGQRLEQLGQMTGGVAHDFNNLLTPIIGGVDLVRRRVPDDPQAQRLLDAALLSAERARTLVSRLLSFARRQSLAPRDVDVVGLLGGLVDLLERSAGPNILIALDLQAGLPTARVDPSQLELAVLNLVVNARDAMPEGGVLTISATEPLADRRRGLALGPGRYVCISVADTGVGMDAATLRRAIEPFFTTKALNKGAGLGLSMVHGLAAQSGGALVLDSAPGKGLRADIWLPAGEAAAAAEPTTAEPETLICAGVGRLLLVDDDDLVRTSTAAVLRDHGHTVLEAGSAFEAMQLLRGGADIDALVTDYAMPGMNGADLIAEARKPRPTLPALLITGFADCERLPPDVLKLDKPFRRVALLNMVARCLAAQPAPSDAG